MVSSVLPSYDDLQSRDSEGCPASPTYSIMADCSEHVVRQQSCTFTPDSECDLGWTFETDHMEVNLGPRIWSLHKPSYGLNGTVEGSVTFKGEQYKVNQVAVKFEGRITTTNTDRGMVVGLNKVSVLSYVAILYSSSQSHSQWDAEHAFSFAFPTEVNINGVTSALPPSFAAYYPGTSSAVDYVIKVDMVRKGLRRHENMTIPILYLPKSRPSKPPLEAIPFPANSLLEMPYPADNCVKTEKLSAFWPARLKRASKPDGSRNSVYLSLPSGLSFTSGELISWMLCIVSPDAPVVAKLIASNIHMQLLKRTRLHGVAGRVTERHVAIAVGVVQQIKESSEGIILLRGIIKAGQAGREKSWQVKGVAEVQYELQVQLQPPSNLVDHLPSFRHEEVVEVATDPWGSHERELLSMGGRPAPPALGLANSPRGRSQY